MNAGLSSPHSASPRFFHSIEKSGSDVSQTNKNVLTQCFHFTVRTSEAKFLNGMEKQAEASEPRTIRSQCFCGVSVSGGKVKTLSGEI